MPKFRNQLISVRHGGTPLTGDNNQPVVCRHEYVINVNSKGEFYATIPDFLEEAAATLGAKKSNRSPYSAQVFDKTLDGLIAKLKEIHEAYLNPQVVEALVIQFDITTHVSFAETPDGDVVPNCYYHPDAEWPTKDDRYGSHPSNGYAGGYSLRLGARAMTKITRRYGNGSVMVSYEKYYGTNAEGKPNSLIDRDWETV